MSDVRDIDRQPVLGDDLMYRFPFPHSVPGEERERRFKAQALELRAEYAGARLRRRRAELALLEENYRMIAPIRSEISDAIDLEEFSDPSDEIRVVVTALEVLRGDAAGAAEVKAECIAKDVEYWRERIQMATGLECPTRLADMVKWFFSLERRERTRAWGEMLAGIDEVRDAHAKLVSLYAERQELIGSSGRYRHDLQEVSLVWELLTELYEEGKTYQGALRRAPRNFFGMRFQNGQQLASPKIRLEASYAGDDMAAHLNGLTKEGEHQLDTAANPSLELQFGGGKLSFGEEVPYLGRDQREVLLNLVSVEEQAWSADGNTVVMNINRKEIAASWKLMRRHLEFLFERIEGREKEMDKTLEELTGLLDEVNGRVRNAESFINGANFAESILGKEQKRCFQLSPAMVKQFRVFMEILGDCTLVRSVFNFANEQGLIVNNAHEDCILEGFAYEYRWGYVQGRNLWQTSDEIGKAIANVWHESDQDFVKWKDTKKYPQKSSDGSRTYHFDGLYSSGERVNPRVFFDGNVYERVVLRVLNELLIDRDEAFQCAMLWGTAEQGNAVYHDDFAEALARKMWEMEKQWAVLSDENRRIWLNGGFARHIDPSGNTVNILRFATYNYYSY